jgi:hypothetical protein
MMCCNERIEPSEVIGGVAVLLVLIFLAGAAVWKISGENAVEKYKRVQECIHKHEASKRVCEDLYE